MPFFKRKSNAEEKRICALCEFSSFDGENFKCKGKKVDAVNSCRRFLFDPTKKSISHQTLADKEIDFEPLE